MDDLTNYVEIAKGVCIPGKLIPKCIYINDRKVGNTTRLIDAAIQTLFKYTQVAFPKFNKDTERDYMLRKLLNRLDFEHNLKYPEDLEFKHGKIVLKFKDNGSFLDLDTLKHVKFIFELHSDNSCSTNGYASLLRIIEKEELKNKPITKEDIESLGFKLINVTKEFFEFTKPNVDQYYYMIQANKKNIGLELMIAEYSYHNENYEEVKFEGNIKSESELKKLLKQLNIE